MKQVCVLLACICSLSGCSLAGYMAGSAMDSSTPDFDTLTTYSSLEPGDDVTIHKRDGSIETGTVAEPLQHLSFEQKLAKISGPSSPAFDLTTGSFSSSIRRIPISATHLVWENLKGDEVSTPLDSIRCIIIPQKKHSAFTGLVLGAAVDIAVVVAIANIRWPGFSLGGGN